MRPIDVKSDSQAEYNVDSDEKDSKSKIGDHVKFQIVKTFLLEDMLLIGHKKFSLSTK